MRFHDRCNYFTFGSGSKQGDCQWETTFSAECKGFGWQADAADFYHVQYRSRLPSSMLLRLANQKKNREIQNEDNVIEIENKGSGGRDGKLTIKAGGILATRQINIPKLFGYADECTGARLGCQICVTIDSIGAVVAYRDGHRVKAFGPDYEALRTTTYDRVWIGRGGKDDRPGRGKLFWAGSVKNVRVYDGKLTAEHVAALAREGPVHRFKMDDGRHTAGAPLSDYGRGFPLLTFGSGKEQKH